MTFLKLLLSSGLIFTTTMALSFNETSDNTSFPIWDYIDHRLSSAIVPIHYNIMLQPFFDMYGYIFQRGGDQKIIDLLENHEITVKKALKHNKTDYQIYFYGQSVITINILRTTQLLVLHSLNLYIDEEVTILIAEQGTAYKPSEHLYNNDIVKLIFTEDLQSGHYNLSMKFVGVLDNKSFLQVPSRDMSSNVKLLIITHFQPIQARRVFPCWDEPTLKATFTISIKHSSLYMALSNMPKIISERIKDYEDEIIQTHFQTTPRIPTYLIAFTLVNMHHRVVVVTEQIENIWWNRIDYYHLYNAQIVTESVMKFLQDYWKNYIKFSKLYYVVVSDAQTESVSLNNIMDNWGLIVYRESEIIGNASDYITKIRLQRLIAYKMTHQLFGNLVSPSRWSYMWLNDALAQFFGMNAISQIYPTHRVIDLFVVQDLQESLRLDYEHIMMSLAVEVRNSSEIENLFSSTRYAFTLRYKAPVLIYMLQHMVTNETLQAGVRKYLSKHSFSSATPDDFWKVMDTVLKKSGQQSKDQLFKLKPIMNSWINKLGYPIVNVTLSSHGHTVIEIMHPTSVGIRDMWKIPFTYTTQTNLNFNDTFPQIWIDHLYLLSIDNEAEWIIVNLQQSGYYRVNYYSENWRRIANFLNSNEYTKIHVLNRAQIIDDAYCFLMWGKLELPIFLELTKYLSYETDYVAWYPIFRIFESISSIIPFLQKWTIFIKVHMRSIVHNLLNKIGYNEQSDEDDLTKCLRKEAIRWACNFGDFECLKHAHMTWELYVEEDEQKSRCPVPPCQAWINYTSLLKRNVDSDTVLDHIKSLILYNIHFIKQMENASWADERERQDDIIKMLYIITNHLRSKRMLKYFLHHFHVFDILPNQLDMKKKITILIIIINHVYDEIQLKMISKMLKTLLHNEKIIRMFEDKIIVRTSHYKTIFESNKYFQYS